MGTKASQMIQVVYMVKAIYLASLKLAGTLRVCWNREETLFSEQQAAGAESKGNKDTREIQKYLEGVKSAAKDQQAIVAQRRHHPQSGEVADQVNLTDTGVVIDHLTAEKDRSSRMNKCNLTFTVLYIKRRLYLWWLYDKKRHNDPQLQQYE